MVSYPTLTKTKRKKIAEKLEMSKKHTELAEKYFSKIVLNNPYASQQVIYAVSVYLSGLKNGSKISMRKIAYVVDCSTIAIQKLIQRMIKDGQLVKEDGSYELKL